MIVLSDPDRRITPAALLAWWRWRYQREPEKLYPAGTWIEDLHYVGYLMKQEFGEIVPRPPADVSRPYSDPPMDESTTLFNEVLEKGASPMPPLPDMPVVLVHPQAFDRVSYAVACIDYAATCTERPDHAGILAEAVDEPIWSVTDPDWLESQMDDLRAAYPAAELMRMDLTPEQLRAMLAAYTGPVTPPAPTKWSGLYGLHGNADAGPVLPVEIELAKRMGIWGNPKGCWLYSPVPQEEWSYEVLNDNGAGIVYARQMVRLGIHKDMPKPPHFYVNGLAQPTGIWDASLEEAGGFGLLGVVLGNEPNVASEGLGTAWTSADDYCLNHLSPCIDLIRQHYLPVYPNLKLITPAISPQPDTLAWWDAFKRYNIFDRCNGMGGHAYFDAEHGAYPMESESGGRHYRKAKPYLQYLNGGRGGSMYLTEISRNKPTDGDAVTGDAYARFLAATESWVAWVTFFVACATDLTFNERRETWARYPGYAISAIPGAFAARWAAL